MIRSNCASGPWNICLQSDFPAILDPRLPTVLPVLAVSAFHQTRLLSSHEPDLVSDEPFSVKAGFNDLVTHLDFPGGWSLFRFRTSWRCDLDKAYTDIPSKFALRQPEQRRDFFCLDAEIMIRPQNSTTPRAGRPLLATKETFYGSRAPQRESRPISSYRSARRAHANRPPSGRLILYHGMT